MIKNREGWKIQLEECSICQKQGKKGNEKGYRKRFYAIEKAEQEKIDAKASNIELTLKQGKASNSVPPQGEIVFFFFDGTRRNCWLLKQLILAKKWNCSSYLRIHT